MKKTARAALLSGLVFPGLGQISLKRYMRGAAFMLLTAGGLTLLVFKAVRDALSILNRMEIQGAVIDFQTLLNLAVESSTSLSGSYRIPLLLIVGCWLISIIDAIRTDKGEGPSG